MSDELRLQKRIFFADDDKRWTDAMMGLFANRGYKGTRACNEASIVIAEATAFQPDILLVDLRWDKTLLGEPQTIQGDDILRDIEQKGLFPATFIAALTQELTPADLAAFKGKWRRFHLILKSDSPDKLIESLRELKVLPSPPRSRS